MKNLLLAAFAALSLSAAAAPIANAAIPNASHHSGPYDNTGNGPNSSGLEGGGG